MGKMIFIIGVSGSGKTTIGERLAQVIHVPFYDADNYHSKGNIRKMSEGIPLNDEDRKGWLIRLNELAQENDEIGCVIACSALKEKYRTALTDALETEVKWVYLQGTFNQIYGRLEQREDHFMKTDLLKSQFAILEEPIGAICVSVEKTPDEIIEEITSKLS